MVTLVERSMGFTMIRKLEKGKDAKGVSQAVYLMLLPYKGSLRYTNKLYRQYIPQKSGFKYFKDNQIKEYQYKINARPRKKLGFRTPLETFYLN